MLLRQRETGKLLSEYEFRSLYSNTSFPEYLSPDLLIGLGFDPVLEGPQPELGMNQYSSLVGIIQDTKGNWITHYEAKNIQNDTINTNS